MGCSVWPDKLGFWLNWRWSQELTYLSNVHDALYERQCPREQSDGIWRDLCLAMGNEVMALRFQGICGVDRKLHALNERFPGLTDATRNDMIELARLARRPAKGRLYWIGKAGYPVLRKAGWFAYSVKPWFAKQWRYLQFWIGAPDE